MQTVEERFWSKVDKTGECWVWTACKFRKGYGSFQLDGRNRGAHRVAYELSVGPIPEGAQLDHTCHTRAVENGECSGGDTCLHRSCVNPDHLEPVTPLENTQRGLSISAVHADKSHCPLGHPYSGENLYIGSRGNGTTFRTCRTCHYEASMRYAERKRVEKAALPSVPKVPKPYCSRGHSMSGDNLYVKPNGKRRCRACAREGERRRRETS